MREPGMLHIDHIVEIRDGGTFWHLDNVRVVCRFHHYSKTIEEIGGRRSGRGRPRAARSDLTPGDPAYCWRKGEDGLWHHYHPMHNIGDCQWPDFPHNKEYEHGKEGRQDEHN
jgi:hypothetical protein